MNANETEHSGTRPSVLAALVVVCSIAAFAPPIGGPWIFDDIALIPGNRFVHDFGLWHHWFTSHLWDTSYDPDPRRFVTFWRPAVLATYALDWRIGGNNPFFGHVANLLLHGLTSLLAFGTLKRWSRSASAAFVGALIFALHPTKAESVAWIAGCPDVLCMLGVLVAIHGTARRLARRRYGIALELVGTALAYLSKEQAVVLPLFVAVEGWAVSRTFDRTNVARAVVPQALVALAYLVARRLWLPIGVSHDVLAITTHAAYVLESFGRYVVLSVWPGDLSFGRAQVSYANGHPTPAAPLVALGIVALVGIVAVAWACRKRSPAITMGLLLFAASLAPVCNIVWIGYLVIISPRFLYLPIFGLAFVATELFVVVGARRALIARVAATVAIVAFGVRSIVRSKDFDAEQTFWTYELTHNPAYSPALMYEITNDLKERRPHAALREAVSAHDVLRSKVPTDSNRAVVTLLALQAVQVLVPDLAREELRSMRAFLVDVRNARDARLDLPTLGLELRIPAADVEGAWLRKNVSMSVEVLEGDWASRLGDDADALDSARRLATECTHCWTILFTTTRIAARAGDLDLATKLLANLQHDAPQSEDIGHLQHDLDAAKAVDGERANASGMYRAVLDARYFSLLGAWGRAYDAAKPAIDAPNALDAASAANLGELCFRAGDAKSAAALFARVMSEADIAARLHALALEMRWVDAPVQGEE